MGKTYVEKSPPSPDVFSLRFSVPRVDSPFLTLDLPFVYRICAEIHPKKPTNLGRNFYISGRSRFDTFDEVESLIQVTPNYWGHSEIEKTKRNVIESLAQDFFPVYLDISSSCSICFYQLESRTKCP